MADENDSGSDGEGKARTFSAEDLAALRCALTSWSGSLPADDFDGAMCAWLARYPDPYRDQELARRAAKFRRESKRTDLDSIFSNIASILSMLEKMERNYNHRSILFHLEPAHDPNPSLLVGDWKQEEIASAKLSAIVASMSTLQAAVEKAIEAEKLGPGRMREWIVRAALIDLGRIYQAATGKLPTGSNDETGHSGDWPAFVRASAQRGWGSNKPLTGHLREVEKFLRQERAQLIARRKMGRFYTFAHMAALVAYHRRVPPNSEAEA